MSRRMITLDKNPGVLPVGARETCWGLFANYVLRIMSTKATNACKDNQLCASLRAVIYRAVHCVQALWDNNSSTNNWGYLLVDAKNVFNEINWNIILWTVRHLVQSGAWFVFNCYRHWYFLVICNGKGVAIILYCREGVKQGGPLTMDAYILGVPQGKKPENRTPWHHATMVCWGCKGTRYGWKIEDYFNSLAQVGLERGYYPEPKQNVLIFHLDNIEGGILFVMHDGFKFCTGAHYLDNFYRVWCFQTGMAD